MSTHIAKRSSMTWLTADDIAAKVYAPGYSPLDDWRGVTTIATLLGESGGNPHAVGQPVQVNVNGTPVWTVALGLGQLLAAYHVDRPPVPTLPRLTVTDCFNPDINWERCWWLLNFGRTGWSYNLTWWDAYKNGSYKQHVPDATRAARTIGAHI